MLLDHQWRFFRGSCEGAENPDFDDSRWEQVSLPHCVSDLFEERPYQGDCWYRTAIRKGEDSPIDALHYLLMEGAMHTADVWVNGEHICTHYGGYLPFHADMTAQSSTSEELVIAIKVNNDDNPDLPPGRPMRMLDRVYYGGLYRNVHELVLNRLHISRPEFCHLPGAGVFVGTQSCSDEKAELHVRCGVMNSFDIPHECRLRIKLDDAVGVTKVESESRSVSVEPGELFLFEENLTVSDPELWSPARPALHTLHLSLVADDRECDCMEQVVGVRHIELDDDKGFVLNGDAVKLHGINRHPDSPGMGSALSDAAHYRDAVRIRQAGFNLVRCGDLPQSPAFLDACDQLGLLVIDSLTGWEYGQQTAAHEQHLFDNCRMLVQRDRNHPSVIAWDVSIYEGGMFEEMMNTMHTIAHDEFPGDQMITLGRSPSSTHDVFGMDCGRRMSIASASLPTLLLNVGGELDEPEGALGFLERASTDMQVPHIGTVIGSMFSHLRGDRGGMNAGLLDEYRRPSPIAAGVRLLHEGDPEPWITLASEWVPGVEKEIVVYSNCHVVSLFLNGEMVETGKSSSRQNFAALAHPPFVFSLPEYQSGTLKAIAYREDKEVASNQVTTPEEAVVLSLNVDLCGCELKADGADAVYVHAETLDQNGTRVTDSMIEVRFQIEGAGVALTPLNVAAVDGRASLLVQSRAKAGEIKISAFSPGLTEGLCRISSG